MQLRYEGRPEYVHWAQSIGAPGAAPGRDFLRSRQPTTSSWSARTPKEPMTDGTAEGPAGAVVPAEVRAAKGRGGARDARGAATAADARAATPVGARPGSSGRSMPQPRGGTLRGQAVFAAARARLDQEQCEAEVGGQTGPPVKHSNSSRRHSSGAYFRASRDKQKQANKMLELGDRSRRGGGSGGAGIQQQEVEELARALRSKIDKDNNGMFEPGESLRSSRQAPKNNETAFGTFNKVDKDHNGLIDEKEFLANLTEDVRAPRKSVRLPAYPLLHSPQQNGTDTLRQNRTAFTAAERPDPASHSELSLLDREAEAKGPRLSGPSASCAGNCGAATQGFMSWRPPDENCPRIFAAFRYHQGPRTPTNALSGVLPQVEDDGTLSARHRRENLVVRRRAHTRRSDQRRGNHRTSNLEALVCNASVCARVPSPRSLVPMSPTASEWIRSLDQLRQFAS